MPKIWIRKVERDRMQDGPGPRTTVWLEGCSIRCPGCQNKALWERTGEGLDVDVAAKMILEVADDQAITITGGEPFDQVDALAGLLTALRDRDPRYPPAVGWRRHIILYTGHTWEDLLRMARVSSDISIDTILLLVSVLVDGPYIPGLDHDHMQWRGSSNQRPIAVQESIGQDEPVLEDWDTPVIDVDANGITLTGGLAKDLDMAGHEIARCGEQQEA